LVPRGVEAGAAGLQAEKQSIESRKVNTFKVLDRALTPPVHGISLVGVPEERQEVMLRWFRGGRGLCGCHSGVASSRLMAETSILSKCWIGL